MPNSGHALFSPSAAHRWVRCPASVALTQRAYELRPELAQEHKPAAEEGTFAHQVVEQCLLHRRTVREELGWLGTSELLQLQEFVDWVLKQPGVLYVEERVAIHEPHCWGTADVIVVGPKLIVADLKFGRVPVLAHGNIQLQAYAYGAMKRFAPDVEHVTLAIFQPRRRTGGAPLDIWETDRQTIEQTAKTLKQAIDAGTSQNAFVARGPHCEYCPARGVVCPLHP